MKDYTFLQKKYIVASYINRGITLVRGEGAYLFDQEGHRYLDFSSGFGVSIFGNAHPVVVDALIKQIKTLSSLHGNFANDIRSRASEALIHRSGRHFAQLYWSNSGSEAIEAALKFAVLATGRRKFVTASGGYHGKTLGALSATDGDKYRAPFEPLLWEFKRHTYGDYSSLTGSIDNATAAVVIEPIQGESGIIVPPKDYLKNARALCDRHGSLLIVDEIQTGVGRTGTFLASSNIASDICCLGKGLAAGLPVGATIMTKRVAGSVRRGIQTSTLGGNPLSMRGVVVTLSLLTDKVLEHVQTVGEYFLSELKNIRSENIKDVRGAGLMIGVEVKSGRDDVLKGLQRKFVLAIPAGENVVRFLPPYIVTKDQIDDAVAVLKKVV